MLRLGCALLIYLATLVGAFLAQVLASIGEQTFGDAIADSWYLLSLQVVLIPVIWNEDIFKKSATLLEAKNRGGVLAPLLPSIPNWRYRLYEKQSADAIKELVQAQEDVRLATPPRTKMLLLEDLSAEEAAFLRGSHRSKNSRFR